MWFGIWRKRRNRSCEAVSTIPAADADEAMREQLEYLIEHANAELCDCSICMRYHRARLVLMEIFGQPETQTKARATGA